MTDPRDLDPAPFDDLPSDIAFGMWLESLDPAIVLMRYELLLSPDERNRLKYLRRRAGVPKGL